MGTVKKIVSNMSNSSKERNSGNKTMRRQTSTMSQKESSCLSRRSSCSSSKELSQNHRHDTGNRNSGLSRETTRSETQVNTKGIGSRTATLYLSRSHSKVTPPSQTGSALRGIFRQHTSSSRSRQTTNLRSRQTTFMLDEDVEFAELMKPKKLQREFTFTGYDIMADCDPPEPSPTEPDEIERHEYVNLYINACKTLGITPATFILHSLMEPNLVMRSRSIGPKGAKAIFIALVFFVYFLSELPQNNQRIRSLDLEDNWLGAEGAASIAELLPQNTLITEINISENRIGGEGMEALASALKDNQVVRKLDVSGSDLFDHDAKHLAEIIENNVWLRELRASHNKFGEIGGLYLGPAIGNNDTLELLDLSWNHFRRQGAMAIAAGVEENGGLSVLDLSWNGFSRAGCRVLGLSLAENYTLEELDLTCNRVDAFAMGSLMEGLKWNEGLKTIRLGQNPITPDVALILLKTIEKAPKSELKDLDLLDVVVDQEFVTTLEKMQTTRVLRVRTGPIINKGEGIVNQDINTFFTNNPLRAMFDYMSDRGYRVIDLFKRFDNDDSHTVTTQDFTKGLLNVHLPLTVGQIEDLVAELDPDKDGKIDLRFLNEAEKTHRRKMFRRKQKLSSADMTKSMGKRKKRVNKREKVEKKSSRLPSIPDMELPNMR